MPELRFKGRRLGDDTPQIKQGTHADLLHSEMVKRLVKDPLQLLEEFDSHRANINHAALGIAGEAGEIVDCLKKYTIYGQPLNRENLIEELGDMEFYTEHLRQATGITREETLTANMEKLSKRYASAKYTDADAKERKDKQ